MSDAIEKAAAKAVQELGLKIIPIKNSSELVPYIREVVEAETAKDKPPSD